VGIRWTIYKSWKCYVDLKRREGSEDEVREYEMNEAIVVEDWVSEGVVGLPLR